MAVMSINPNDFLTNKQDGEFVTAEEWNKLVALFTVLNNNAIELLNTNQAVDSNKANILHLTAGAVPDESITCEKLATKTTLKNIYNLTQDLTPDANKTYYTYENGVYTAVDTSDTFEEGVGYYELSTEYANPAINSSDVIGNKVITGENIADEVLEQQHCVPNLLGQLLNNCTIESYSKAVQVAASSNTTVTFKLDKTYNAIVLLNADSLILVRAGDNKVVGISAKPYANMNGISNYLQDFVVVYNTPDKLATIKSYSNGEVTISFQNLGGIYLNPIAINLSGNRLTITFKNLQTVEVSKTISTTVLGL